MEINFLIILCLCVKTASLDFSLHFPIVEAGIWFGDGGYVKRKESGFKWIVKTKPIQPWGHL